MGKLVITEVVVKEEQHFLNAAEYLELVYLFKLDQDNVLHMYVDPRLKKKYKERVYCLQLSQEKADEFNSLSSFEERKAFAEPIIQCNLDLVDEVIK